MKIQKMGKILAQKPITSLKTSQCALFYSVLCCLKYFLTKLTKKLRLSTLHEGTGLVYNDLDGRKQKKLFQIYSRTCFMFACAIDSFSRAEY